MPMYLEPVGDLSLLHGYKSVLIVVCPMCPAVSLAIQQRKPYMEFLRHLFGTGALKEHVAALQDDLKRHGIRTGYFTSYFPLPLMCIWSARQRQKLAKRARGYEAIAVVGCDAATFNAANVVALEGCKVVQVMHVTGIISAVPTFTRPCSLTLKTLGQKSVAWPSLPPQRAIGELRNEIVAARDSA